MRLKVPLLGYLLAFFGLLLPSAVLVSLLPSLIDAQAARERLIAELTEWTGGQVEVTEATSSDSYFFLSIELKDVTITQLSSTPAILSVRAQKIEARVSSLDLIFGKSNFKNVKISGATIDVDATTPHNAALAVLTLLSGTKENPFTRYVLRDSFVVMREEQGKPSRSVHVDSARATVERPSGTVSMSGILGWEQEIFSFSVSKGLTEVQDVHIPLKLRLAGRLFSGEFEGDATMGETAWLATGLTSFRTDDAARFYAWLGLGARPIPADSFELRGIVDATPERLSLQAAELSLGGQSATGDITATLSGSAPRLEGKLVFGCLDLNKMFDPNKGPLPLADVQEIDFRVSAESVKWRDVQTGSVAFTVNSQADRLLIEIAELDFMDGAVRGQFGVNVAEKPLRVRANLIADNVNVASLLSLLKQRNWVSGKAAAHVEADWHWSDGEMRDVSVKQARISFPDGGRIGLDIPALTNSAAAGPVDGWGTADTGRTSFDDMRLMVTLQNGLVRYDNVELQAGNKLITGAGSFDLSAGVIDARFEILHERNDSDLGLNTATVTSPAEPKMGLSIKGVWTHPIIRAEMSQASDLSGGPAKAAVLEVGEPQR